MRLLLCSILIAAAPAQLWAESAISKRLRRISQSLIKDYRAKRPDSQKLSLAILTFNASKELTRQRVGFALSELMLHHFAKVPAFTLIERADLNKILGEQKLQHTGAIDRQTAVKVGKLVGAQVLVLGSVEKLGGNYQVNARVVEVRQVGKTGDHLKMRVSHNGDVWDAIAFRQGDRLDAASHRIDLLYTVGLNNWGGRSRMELAVQEFRPSG